MSEDGYLEESTFQMIATNGLLRENSSQDILRFLVKTVIEPYRVKVTEPIKFTSKEERARLLRTAGYNLFKLRAEDVIVDLLTDSGTSAMSAAQWSALMSADESYAGATSFFKFERAAQDLLGFPHILPVHQGRAAERLFFGAKVRCGDIIPSNTHFDTTRANIQRLSGIPCDLPVENAEADSLLFRGNIDLERLRQLLRDQPERVPFGMLTLTNNACAGQPVSYDNVLATAKLLNSFGKELYIDAARCVENAYLVFLRDPAFRHHTIKEIVGALMKPAAGCLMSAKKDGIANTGGLIALRDAQLTEALKQSLIVSEGFPTYGGLSGRDLETIAVGFDEVTDLEYLSHRWETAKHLAEQLVANDVPTLTPPAMHAVYLDALEFLPHLERAQLPGQALVCELYLEAGVRACEIGTVMLGGETSPRQELVRLALPRRVYSESHYDYVAEAIINVFHRRDQIRGFSIANNESGPLRHFTADFEPAGKVECKEAGDRSVHMPVKGKPQGTTRGRNQ